jgi:hypothetical protein
MEETIFLSKVAAEIQTDSWQHNLRDKCLSLVLEEGGIE